MPVARTLPYSVSLPQANDILWAWFVAITLPTGVQRFTNFDVRSAPGILSYSLDPDGGGAHDWFFDNGSAAGGAYGLMVGPISQGDQSASVVSWVSLIDLDGTIYNLGNTVYGDATVGLCGRPVDIWRAQFDPVARTLGGTTLFFRGIVDSQEYGTRAIISLDPFRTRVRQAPWLTASQLGAGPLRPDVERTIQWP